MYLLVWCCVFQIGQFLISTPSSGWILFLGGRGKMEGRVRRANRQFLMAWMLVDFLGGLVDE